jgi:hypothetical protein
MIKLKEVGHKPQLFSRASNQNRARINNSDKACNGFGGITVAMIPVP